MARPRVTATGSARGRSRHPPAWWSQQPFGTPAAAQAQRRTEKDRVVAGLVRVGEFAFQPRQRAGQRRVRVWPRLLADLVELGGTGYHVAHRGRRHGFRNLGRRGISPPTMPAALSRWPTFVLAEPTSSGALELRALPSAAASIGSPPECRCRAIPRTGPRPGRRPPARTPFAAPARAQSGWAP